MNDVTILVVDDESRMRKLIKDFLMQKGFIRGRRWRRSIKSFWRKWE